MTFGDSVSHYECLRKKNPGNLLIMKHHQSLLKASPLVDHPVKSNLPTQYTAAPMLLCHKAILL